MRITPLDIQKQQFRLSFRGFDVREVDAFLTAVAEEFKDLVSDNEAVKAEVARLEQQLAEYRRREKTLQDTLFSAQRMAETLKEEARREAEILVSEARLRAEKSVTEGNQQLARLYEELNGLRRQYAQFEIQIRSAVETHLRLLDAGRQEYLTAPQERAVQLSPGPEDSAKTSSGEVPGASRPRLAAAAVGGA
ncbi:MAG: DivIVA domain-containing protein [Pseudomonadota bacterium]